MTENKPWLRKIRSFIRRDSRITALQENAFNTLWTEYGLLHTEKYSFNESPILEIGFGSGHSLAEVSQLFPEHQYIGIETFKPGLGSLLNQIKVQEIKNLRLYYHDAVEVLEKCMEDNFLSGIQIFFPDPWPKTRHHKRRLIQTDFVRLATIKLKSQGFLHLATDDADYAKHMMKVLSQESGLYNTMGAGKFAERSPFRPLITKFESRGHQEGRPSWDLQFAKL